MAYKYNYLKNNKKLYQKLQPRAKKEKNLQLFKKQFKLKSNAGFRGRPFHEPNLIRIKADPNYLDPLN